MSDSSQITKPKSPAERAKTSTRFKLAVVALALLSAVVSVYCLGLIKMRGDYLLLVDGEVRRFPLDLSPVGDGIRGLSATSPDIVSIRALPWLSVSINTGSWTVGYVSIRHVSSDGLSVVNIKPADGNRDDCYMAIRLPFGVLEEFESAYYANDWIGAERALRTATSAHPQFDILHAYHANALYRIGKKSEAVAIWDRLAAKPSTTWIDDYVHAIVDLDRRVADPDGLKLAEVWPSRYGNYLTDWTKPLRRDYIDLLADWRSWRNHRSMWLDRTPNFLVVQVSSKTARVEATMASLIGDDQRARDILLGMMHWKPCGQTDIGTIPFLIHVAHATITLRGWQDYVFGFPREAAELAEIWAEQEESLNILGWEPWDKYRILLRSVDHYSKIDPSVKDPFAEIDAEANIRYAVLRSRMSLARQGLRILHDRRASGNWPPVLSKTEVTTPTLWVEPEPRDFFDADGRLYYLAPAGPNDPFNLYSIGPDKVDGGALVEFDPTNGTTSAGDHILTLRP